MIKVYNRRMTAVFGDIAQLVERTDRTREVRGSNPLVSNFFKVSGQSMPMHFFRRGLCGVTLVVTGRANCVCAAIL